MNKSFIKTLFIAIPLTLAGVSCSKSKDDNNGDDTKALQTQVLADASVVCRTSYQDMYTKAVALQASIAALNTTTNADNLATSRANWKAMRNTWEQTEAWLFGPVSANEIDPRIDTWPVDFTALDGIINGSDVLNEAYVDGLEESLKGFHPIEYLLWGQNGNKTAAQFTIRQKQYLVALTANLVKLTTEVRDSWVSDGYDKSFAAGGKASMLQLVDGMAGIAEEVGTAKMQEPFDASDPTLEESPFAKNSITDFTNNIKGIMAMYQGKFTTDGKGMEDFVRAGNLSLDASIKAKHAAAIAALAEISKPFGDAITQERSKVSNAMTKIGELQAVLNGDLRVYINATAVN
jgi:putative iron-regulated protein